MGLFDLLGSNSPMFIPTQRRETGLNIDWGNLMPALPKQQQAPQVGPNYDASKMKWTSGQLMEQEQKEALAQQLVKKAYLESGGNLASLPNNQSFKQAQSLYTVNPEELQRKNNEYDQYIKRLDDPEFRKKASALDIGYFKATGGMRTVGEGMTAFDKATSSDLNSPEYQSAKELIFGAAQPGTQDDLDKDMDNALKEATGTTSAEWTKMTPAEREGTGGILNSLMKREGNAEQLHAAAIKIVSNLNPEAQYALEADFIKDSGGTATKESNPRAYADYVVDKVRQYVNPKLTTKSTDDTTYQKLFDEHTRAKEDKQSRLMDEEIRNPWTDIFQGRAQPIKTEEPKADGTGGYTVQAKGADGKYKDVSLLAPLHTYSGMEYNYTAGRNQPVSGDTFKSGVIFGGKYNSSDIFRNAKIVNISTGQDPVDIRKNQYPEYFKDAKDGEELSAEEIETLDKAGKLKRNVTAGVTYFIPDNEWSRVSQQLIGIGGDENEYKEESAYSNSLSNFTSDKGSDDFESKGLIRPGKMIDPKTEQDEHGMYVNASAIISPGDAHVLGKTNQKKEETDSNEDVQQIQKSNN